MASQWFRFYDEALNDPKVQSLDGDTFKVWINLLCVTSQCDGHIFFDDISFHLRMGDKEALAYCVKLADKGLLIPSEHGYIPNAWEKRQYKTDTSADRTKAYRERKKLAKRDGVVTSHVTPPDTDTDTDTELKKINKKSAIPKSVFLESPKPPPKKFSYSQEFLRFWEAYPYQKGSKARAQELYDNALNNGVLHDELLRAATAYAGFIYATGTERRFTKNADTWLGRERHWETDWGAATAEANASADGSAGQHGQAGGGKAAGKAARRDSRDPAARAHDEAQRIIAERRERWAAEDAAKAAAAEAEGRQVGAGTADATALPDLRQPADLRRQGADDGIPRPDVSDGAGRLPVQHNSPSVYSARKNQ
jgi:hypothetical protein